MDAQRKKGILDVCVLAVLKKGPSYGYKIIRDISRCIDISESTLYPILKRLEQNGSLKTYRRQYNGRIRKYYELTQAGQDRIDVFLEEWEELRTMYLFIEEENRRMPEEDPSARDEVAGGSVERAEGIGSPAEQTEGADLSARDEVAEESVEQAEDIGSPAEQEGVMDLSARDEVWENRLAEDKEKKSAEESDMAEADCGQAREEEL